jgi:hypothetical protein
MSYYGSHGEGCDSSDNGRNNGDNNDDSRADDRDGIYFNGIHGNVDVGVRDDGSNEDGDRDVDAGVCDDDYHDVRCSFGDSGRVDGFGQANVCVW